MSCEEKWRSLALAKGVTLLTVSSIPWLGGAALSAIKRGSITCRYLIPQLSVPLPRYLQNLGDARSFLKPSCIGRSQLQFAANPERPMVAVVARVRDQIIDLLLLSFS
jgi:hypothetical protein